MASTVTATTYPLDQVVVLPSIHEMFPEHLVGIPYTDRRFRLRTTPQAQFSRRHRRYQLAHPAFSFDVNPHSLSLNHIASSRAASQRTRRAPISPPQMHPGPVWGYSYSGSVQLDGDGEPDMYSDVGGGEGEEYAGEGRKHVCVTCAKRFNRPSSLRIHVNTHTGATPFRCPYPSCGRAFNVNSNMRRHFRNHPPTPSSFPRAVPTAFPSHAVVSVHGSATSPPSHRESDSPLSLSSRKASSAMSAFASSPWSAFPTPPVPSAPSNFPGNSLPAGSASQKIAHPRPCACWLLVERRAKGIHVRHPS